MDREAVRKAFAMDLMAQPFNDLFRDIWLEKGADESEIIYPVLVHDHVVWSPQQFPCGEIMVGHGTMEQPDRQHIDYHYQVTIFWHANGSDEGDLETLLDRLIRATQDYYKAKATLSPTLEGAVVWLGDDDPSPLIRWEGDRPYVRSMAQDLFVRVIR